jgi:hypothetical protein
MFVKAHTYAFIACSSVISGKHASELEIFFINSSIIIQSPPLQKNFATLMPIFLII